MTAAVTKHDSVANVSALRREANAQSVFATSQFKIVHKAVSEDIIPEPLQTSVISLPLSAWGTRDTIPRNSFGSYIKKPKKLIIKKSN